MADAVITLAMQQEEQQLEAEGMEEERQIMEEVDSWFGLYQEPLGACCLFSSRPPPQHAAKKKWQELTGRHVSISRVVSVLVYFRETKQLQ